MLLFCNIKSYKRNNVKLWTSSDSPYIILFLQSVNSYCYFHILFHVPWIMLIKVYFYIVSSRFPFLFNRSQSKASVVNQISHLFFEVQKYFFALFNFLIMVIFTTLFRRWSTLWNSTLKITALFRRCLTLLVSTMKLTTLIWSCSTL